MAVSLRARKECRQSVVNYVYSAVAGRHPPYVLGGARLYWFMWRTQQKYALALAGLVWLLHNPITKLKARAETVRKRMDLLPKFDVLPHTEIPVYEQAPAMLQEVCRVS